ncbi:MAG: protein-disulfide reductase DsbD domain-containing protein, partial [Vibrio anguillarum]
MRLLFSFVLLALLTLSQPALAVFGNDNPFNSGNNLGLASADNQFVPVDQAFPFHAEQQGKQIFLDWQVKQGYYLYQDRISISAENAQLGEIEMLDGQPYR